MNLLEISPSHRNVNLLFANFNQDYSFLSIGTSDGFKVFSIYPKIVEVFSQALEGISICEMLFCTSLIAIVGSGETTSSMSSRKLLILNTKNQSTICELNFTMPIISVKLNRKRIIVLLETKIHIYDISSLKLLHTIDTVPNPRGICALSSGDDSSYLGFPASNERGDIMIFDVLTLQACRIIRAHQTPVSKIAINSSGTLIASASSKGTVIRVFTLPNGGKWIQLRRGSYPAMVYSMSFSVDSTLLCASSDTGTIHIFKLEQLVNNATTVQSSSPFSVTQTLANHVTNLANGMSSYLPEVISDIWDTIPIRSFATLKVASGIETLCAIHNSNSAVIIVSSEGIVYQFHMDPKIGGELKLSAECRICKSKNEEVSSQFINGNHYEEENSS